MISVIDNPDTLHPDVDADAVEWKPNMLTLIPGYFSLVACHLEKVVVEIGDYVVVHSSVITGLYQNF